MAQYDNAFFEYVNSGATRSARKLLPHLTTQLQIRSVLDVGCGQGAWLSVWRELGVQDVTGVDGDYVDRDRLLVNEAEFIPRDLGQPFSLDRRFDLVQSLEVAEHLHRGSAETFVASLVGHTDTVLFSAAPKGQGGDHHINEQPYDYWRALFATHDFVALDYIRPRVQGDKDVEPWYRFNTFLYVRESTLQTLPASIRATRVPADQRLRDISPPTYKLRKRLIGLLPVSAMTGIAKLKEHHVARRRLT